jgi:hypothetical protein
MAKVERREIIENPEYLQGYRDGQRDSLAKTRRGTGDGILGALLAIALLCGLGYLAYNYAIGNLAIPQVRIESR